MPLFRHFPTKSTQKSAKVFADSVLGVRSLTLRSPRSPSNCLRDLPKMINKNWVEPANLRDFMFPLSTGERSDQDHSQLLGIVSYPIGSMYGIFTYVLVDIYGKCGKYTIHGWYGYPGGFLNDSLSQYGSCTYAPWRFFSKDWCLLPKKPYKAQNL